MQNNLKSFIISFYIWAFVLTTLLPLFTLYSVIWLLVFPFDRGKIIPHFYTVLWTRLYLTINPGWNICIENKDKLISSKHYILVSNHQSIIDIALLLQLRINFKWVSKIELAKVPFIGWVIWMNDHILVRRGDKQSVSQMADACKSTLTSGISIFMFPEGTRTGDGELQAFKEGAFMLAKDSGVAILPIVLDGAGKALPRKGFRFQVNQNFNISVLDEISPETIGRLSLAQLIDHTRNEMVQELDRMRNRDNVH